MERMLRHLFAAALLLGSAACHSGHHHHGPSEWGTWPEGFEGVESRAAALAMAISELRALGQADRALRQEVAASTSPEGADPELLHELAHFRRSAAERVAAVAEHFDWPTRSRFGAEAAEQAWWFLLHADHDPALQAKWLPRLMSLAEEGEVERSHAALLEDRVAVGQGRPQRYGSQMTVQIVGDGYRLVPATPIADPEDLDARRAAVGLEPHAEYLAQLRRQLTGAQGIEARPDTAGSPSTTAP